VGVECAGPSERVPALVGQTNWLSAGFQLAANLAADLAAG
jgi:hypothetical protein